jgi:hypothetical protein
MNVAIEKEELPSLSSDAETRSFQANYLQEEVNIYLLKIRDLEQSMANLNTSLAEKDARGSKHYRDKGIN